MTPIPSIGRIADMDTSSASSGRLLRRTVASHSLIATIVVLSVASTLLVATATFLLVKIWKTCIAGKTEPQPTVTLEKHGAPSERRQSDWARKNSNVLWSMYIDDDDLKAQFAMSPKSRLFSIGSVSTVDQGRCPLDRRQSHVNPLSQHKVVKENHSNAEDTIDLRNRTPYEHQTTPTKSLSRARALSQPSKHRHSCSFEEIAKRKQSLPMPARSEE